MQSNAASAMTQAQPPSCGIDTCEPQVSAVRIGKVRRTAFSKGHYPGVAILNDTLPGVNSIGFWDCGFNSSQYFATGFRKRFNMSLWKFELKHR